MAELYKVEFPKSMRGNRVFENRLLLDEFKLRSTQKETLPMVQRCYGELIFPDAYKDRPYIYCSLVSSIDGRIAFVDDPVSTYLARNNFLDEQGGLLNFWSLMMQRTHADASITATKTLISEPEATLHICDSTLIDERMNILGKKTKHPLNIVISRGGNDVPFEHKIFNSLADEDLHVLLVTSMEGKRKLCQSSGPSLQWIEVTSKEQNHCIHTLQEAVRATDLDSIPVLVMPGSSAGEIDTSLLLWVLRQIGIQHLFVEAPRYMYHLMEEKLLDEFFIDFSLLFAGGDIMAGMGFEFSSTHHPHTELVSLGIHNQNFMYTRQRIVYDAGCKR